VNETGQQSNTGPEAAPLAATSLLGDADAAPRGCLWRAWHAFKLVLVSVFGLFVVCVSSASLITGESVEVDVNKQAAGTAGQPGDALGGPGTTSTADPSGAAQAATGEASPAVAEAERSAAIGRMADDLARAINPSATSSSPGSRSPESTGDTSSLARLESELAAMYWSGALDTERVRRRIEAHRVAINIEMAQVVHEGRAVWLRDLRRALEVAALVALALLLGPFWVYRQNRSRGRGPARRLALATLPYFIAATAATLVVTDVIASVIMLVQVIQLDMAVFVLLLFSDLYSSFLLLVYFI
jgi:hypothetical protein